MQSDTVGDATGLSYETSVRRYADCHCATVSSR